MKARKGYTWTKSRLAFRATHTVLTKNTHDFNFVRHVFMKLMNGWEEVLQKSSWFGESWPKDHVGLVNKGSKIFKSRSLWFMDDP